MDFLGLLSVINSGIAICWFNTYTSTTTVNYFPITFSFVYGIFSRTYVNQVQASAGTALVAKLTNSSCMLFVRETGSYQTYSTYAMVIGCI